MQNKNNKLSAGAAVFLDRDGTIIEDRGYLSSPGEVVFIPGVFEALRSLAAEFALFIVTNQGGVAKGLNTAAEVETVNNYVVESLRRAGVGIVEVYVCPHDRGDACECRKPSPYFLRQAARDYGIDLRRSFVVGDHPHDVGAALAADARGIYVLSGHGTRHLDELPDGGGRIVVDDIVGAAEVILAESAAAVGELSEAAAALRRGELVVFPTETVYGLGANAFDPAAVARVFAAKDRPFFDPLIVHVADASWLDRLCAAVPAVARRLAAEFWPGPLTLVLPRRPTVPDLVTSGLPSVAVRVPNHPLALELLRQTRLPLAAPSANPFGGVSPTTAAHARDGLRNRVERFLDGGPCGVGVESTVVRIEANGGLTLLRPGGTPVEAIAATAGVEVSPSSEPVAGARAPLDAPGMLKRHYSPATPLELLPRGGAPESGTRGRSGLLLASRNSRLAAAAAEFAAVEYLSDSGDDKQMARNLFAALRRLDAAGLERVFAETVDEGGLGAAVNDRLRRAGGDRQSTPSP